MKKIFIFVLFCLLLFGIFNATAKIYQPLKKNWEWPIAANKIYSFSLNASSEEIYACIYYKPEEKGLIKVLNKRGELILDTWIKGYMVTAAIYKKQVPCQEPNATGKCYEWFGKTSKFPGEVKFLFVSDTDLDGNLDIFASCEATGGGVTSYILYAFEREFNEASKVIENKGKWFYDKAELITSGIFEDIDSDGIKDIIFSSLDSSIYVFTSDGKLKREIQLNGSVWDIAAYDIENDKKIELIAGHFSGISAIKNYALIWDFKTNERIFDVEVLESKNGTLIIGASKNSLYCLDAQGNEKWKKEISDIEGIAKLDVDNDGKHELLVLANNEIHAINFDGKEKWKYEILEPSNVIYTTNENEVLVSGKKLYSFSLDENSIKNELAFQYLEDAKNFYLEDNCDKAINLAEKAKKIFHSIDNVDGLIECDRILLHCLPSPEVEEEIKRANEYFAIAQEYYSSEEFKKAKEYATKAMDIYAKWGYKDETIKCDMLLNEINKKIFVEGEVKAREFYLKAVDLLNNGDLDNATIYANKALQIYADMDSESGISSANSLLSEISKRRNEMLAESYLEEAKKNFEFMNFEDTSKYAEMAKKIYLATKNDKKIEECNALISQVKRYKEANEYYENAVKFFNEGKYKNASENAKKAKEIFEELKNEEGIKKVDELLKKLEGMGVGTGLIYLGVIIGILIFIAIGVLLRKRVI
ncbi:MAG: hypothetical protein QW802_03120 [Candidatus Altiarchaeota archaeon]